MPHNCSVFGVLLNVLLPYFLTFLLVAVDEQSMFDIVFIYTLCKLHFGLSRF